jgi:signal transduction histidine kinase
VALPIVDGRAGTIRLGLSKHALQSEVAQLTFTLLGLTGGVLLLGLLVAYFLATVLTRPLTRLAEATRAVGRGELSQRVEVTGHDEAGRLAAAFNVMTETLEDKEDERTRLLGKVISAQEEERKRIARELHDEASQALTSLMLGLKHLEEHGGEKSMQHKVAELRSLASDTLDQMHDLALELRPTALDDLGLVAALDRYVKDYAEKHGLNADFHAGSLDTGRLPPQEETALYRIAQEALTNVVKHAGAENVSILLEQRDNTAVLIVEDDGKGFDLEAVTRAGGRAQRLGLLGMEERASLIGGRLTIESRPGGGTAVFVEIPIARNGQWNGSASS